MILNCLKANLLHAPKPATTSMSICLSITVLEPFLYPFQHSRDMLQSENVLMVVEQSREATSIDALAVGLTFAFIKTDIVIASSTIGVVSFVVTALAFLLGRKVSGLVGKRAEIIGGIVLIGIGVKILLEHTL